MGTSRDRSAGVLRVRSLGGEGAAYRAGTRAALGGSLEASAHVKGTACSLERGAWGGV